LLIAVTMTFTTLLLLAMLVAVFVIAGRVWWALRAAERRHRALGSSMDRKDTWAARRRD
jgi:ABC-type branched-subunit amino acid transport system permease subunit